MRPPTSAVLTSEDLATSSGLRRAIITLAWPVLAEMTLMTVTQIVDMAMVSRLGPVAIASIGLSFQPFFLAMSIFMGLAVGTTALVARNCGAGDYKRASSVARQSLTIAVLLGALLITPAYLYAEKLILIMGGEPAVIASGSIYLRSMMPGVMFMIMRFILAFSLRGAGDTRTPMKISFIVNILNVFANWVLIFGNLGFPALGVMGAGIGTSVARSIGGFILLYFMFQPDSVIKIEFHKLLKLQWTTIRSVARIGVPAALERMTMSGAQIIYIRIVAALGTLDYAAHAIAINAESISFMPAFAFAQAATTLVGQNLGANQPSAATRSGYECFRLGAVVAGLGTIVLLTFPYYLMRIYTTDPELIAKGMLCLRIMALAQIPMAAGFIFPGALRGAGDTRSVMIVTFIGAWGVRLTLAYLLVIVLGWGLGGAWIAMAMDWVLRGSITTMRFASKRWQHIKV